MKREILNSKYTRKKYKNFLKGKRVALVGPSNSTEGTNQHDLIESYDIVIRLNDGYVLPKMYSEDIGERTDILYTSTRKNIYFGKEEIYDEKTGKFKNKILRKFNRQFKWISIASASTHKSHALSIRDIPKKFRPAVYFVEESVYQKAKKGAWRLRKRNGKQVSRKITTGFVAICDLLQYEIEELYITGLTFYRQDNQKRVRQYRRGIKRRRIGKYDNNSIGEFHLFVEMLSSDDRIVCDNCLTNIVQQFKEA